MAAIKLRILVNELSNVMLAFDEIKVYRSITVEAGPFTEVTGPGTRITLVAGTTLYEYIDTSGDAAYWYKFAFYNSGTASEGSSSPAIQPEGAQGQYCTISDIRNEGVTEALYSDARVSYAITVASQQIEMYTGRWFEPRNLDFRVDGRNARSIHLDMPIIEISNVYVGETEVALTDLIIYNRHMQGLTVPDDRDNPRVELLQTLDYDFSMGGAGLRWFPLGQQNVRLVGTFGYTDYDGTATGKIPLPITYACKLLTLRELMPMSDPSSAEAGMAWRTQLLKTRDQQIGYWAPSSTAGNSRTVTGAFTGDPRIDTILMRYRRTAQMRAV